MPDADGEAIAAAIWYDNRQPGLGSDFLFEYQQALDRIRRDPESLPRLDSYHGPHEIRRVPMARFAYGLLFLCRPIEVLVVATAHVRRGPYYWLERLPTE